LKIGSRGRGSPLIEDKYFLTYDASYICLDLWIWWLCLLLILVAYVFEYMDFSNPLDEMWWVDPSWGSFEMQERKARFGKRSRGTWWKGDKHYKLPMKRCTCIWIPQGMHGMFISAVTLDVLVSPMIWWECLFLWWLIHAYEINLDLCFLWWNDAPGVEHFDLIQFYKAIFYWYIDTLDVWLTSICWKSWSYK